MKKQKIKRNRNKGFISRVETVINDSDLILEILDARFPEKTRNLSLEKKIEAKEKKLIFILNKSDLVPKKHLEKTKKKLKKTAECIFVSAKQRYGFRLIRKEIRKALGNKGRVGVIGYPNVGKSSIINTLKGRKVAPVSIKAGFTRGEKLIKIYDDIYIIDTPGIIPFDEKDEFKLMLLMSKNPNQVKDIELAGIKLVELFLEKNPKALKEYGMEIESKDAEEILENFAIKKKKMKKKGIPNTEAVSKQIIMDYQKGKLKLFE